MTLVTTGFELNGDARLRELAGVPITENEQWVDDDGEESYDSLLSEDDEEEDEDEDEWGEEAVAARGAVARGGGESESVAGTLASLGYSFE